MYAALEDRPVVLDVLRVDLRHVFADILAFVVDHLVWQVTLHVTVRRMPIADKQGSARFD